MSLFLTAEISLKTTGKLQTTDGNKGAVQSLETGSLQGLKIQMSACQKQPFKRSGFSTGPAS